MSSLFLVLQTVSILYHFYCDMTRCEQMLSAKGVLHAYTVIIIATREVYSKHIIGNSASIQVY